MTHLCCEDEDLLSEPCMTNLKKKSKTVQNSVKQLKKARSRMKVLTSSILVLV